VSGALGSDIADFLDHSLVDAPMTKRNAVWPPGVPPEAFAALEAIYRRLDTIVAQNGPRCDASGRCCRFDSYGHQMYVSTLEMEYFAHGMGLTPVAPDDAQTNPPKRIALPQLPSDGCPWQVNGLCTARDVRPLGCRIYFCDPRHQAWQPEVYETLHREILQLHARVDLPYRYMEWRRFLNMYQSWGRNV
jgi:Fe-S-cluster containining protein